MDSGILHAAGTTPGRVGIVGAGNDYNALQHPHPHFVANPELVGSADLPVTEDVWSRIVAIQVRDEARVLAAAQERGTQ